MNKKAWRLPRECPLTCGKETKVLRSSFIKVCLERQKITARIDFIKRGQTYKKVDIYKNKKICKKCYVGRRIRLQRKLPRRPPKGISFIHPATFKVITAK